MALIRTNVIWYYDRDVFLFTHDSKIIIYYARSSNAKKIIFAVLLISPSIRKFWQRYSTPKQQVIKTVWIEDLSNP